MTDPHVIDEITTGRLRSLECPNCHEHDFSIFSEDHPEGGQLDHTTVVNDIGCGESDIIFRCKECTYMYSLRLGLDITA